MDEDESVGVAALPESEAVPEDPADPEPEAVPLGIAESAPGVGAPKVEIPEVIGPTGADAEAPMPTKNPTPCYNNARNKQMNNNKNETLDVLLRM